MSEPSQPKNNNNKGEGSSTKKKTYRRPKKKTQEPANGEQKTNSSQPKFNKNRAQSKLTIDDGSAASSSVTTPPPEKKKRNPRNNRNHKKIKLPEGEHDLSTVLTHDLRNSSYECMICMDVIRPAHQVWTCDCCWAVFHLNCIHQWANKSLKGKYRTHKYRLEVT
jgi:transcriptional repressor NF-X1